MPPPPMQLETWGGESPPLPPRFLCLWTMCTHHFIDMDYADQKLQQHVTQSINQKQQY